MDKDIGRIIEVRGVDVKAKLFRLLPPYLIKNGQVVSAPKINSFVKTKVGLDTIICQVIGEYNIEKEDRTLDHFLDLKVKGYIEKGKFIQGLRMLPIVSSNLSLLNNDDYSIVYNNDLTYSFPIGDDLFEVNKAVFLKYNEIIPSHVGIFGNTGSGKSNTLSSILSNYVKELSKYRSSNAKVLVFDLNNEYGKDAICNETEKVIYNLTTRTDSKKKIPFKFCDISEDDFCILLNATVKTQAPTLKNAFRMMKKDNDISYYRGYIARILKNNRRDLFFSIRMHLGDYLKNVDEISWYSKSDIFYVDIGSGRWMYSNQDEFEIEVINKIIIDIPNEPLDRILFELCFSIAKECEHGINSDYLLPLLHRAEKLFSDLKKVFDFESSNDLFENKSIAIIQLANTNMDMEMIIPSLITNVIFQNQLKAKGEGEVNSIINVVIDEAHNILYKDDESILHNSVLASFEKVVKEGRKFGVFLMIASQRPSDISNTVLSQLHNYFIHKLVNPNDLFQIRKTVAFLDENALNFLTILAPGECILSGTALKMPSFVHVYELEEKTKPNSSNVILFGESGIISKKK